MEKLLKLLNEYMEFITDGITFVDYDKETYSFETLDDGKVSYLWDEYITSLRFWFVDWLFDKEYIDMKKCMKDEDFKTLMAHYEAPDCALMCLATRYSNIDLLINWLKDD